jgi:hypothetical protein
MSSFVGVLKLTMLNMIVCFADKLQGVMLKNSIRLLSSCTSICDPETVVRREFQKMGIPGGRSTAAKTSTMLIFPGRLTILLLNSCSASDQLD